MSKPFFLLLTASIGAGHTKAAQAIAESLRAQNPAVQVLIVDWSSRSVSPTNWLTKKIYLNMLSIVPNLYDVFYKASADGVGGALARHTNEKLMRRTMTKLLAKYRPDAVICTHPFPAGAAAAVKRHSGTFPLITVLTDYTVHKLWIYKETDLIFTATEKMREELLSVGFPSDKTAACGIPIRRAFSEIAPKKTIRQNLGIADEKKMLVMMGGGLGLGDMEHTIDTLTPIESPLEIFVLTGRNERLRKRMTAKAESSPHNLRVMGYTEDTAIYMRAADLIITKPGALTLSESFALGLPLLLHEPIPGPETGNARYAVENGAAVWAKGDIGQQVKKILFDDEKLRAMQSAALSLARPNAAAEIAARIYAAAKI